MQEEYLPEMERARMFLKDLLLDMGFEVQILKAKKHDAVFGQKIVDAKLPTVLIYGHYDVQPPEPLEEWKSPPFEPTIRGNKIFARGATDDKGQLMVHLMATKKLIENFGNQVPVNIKFIIEGEEEIGSISVAELAKKYSKNLLKADYIIVSDGEMYKKDHPSIEISLRGLVYAEVFLETAEQDLHSGQYGGVAENPAVVLARIITQLKDSHNRILIPRFYDNVIQPTQDELKDYEILATTPEKIMQEGKLFDIGGGEDWYSLNERRWSRPTLDVNGIVSGYTGEGSKTIIPAKASAKISMRLVPNQDPSTIFAEFERFIHKIAPKNVKIKVINHSGALPYKSPTSHPIYQIAKQTLENTFGNKVVFIGVGGSIGFIPVLTQELGIPALLIGFGLADENLHSPNEHFDLENFNKGIEAMVKLYTRVQHISH